jgi:Lrp/AsnC family transcriptional regulator, leucine-responsive regulatory protein
MPTNLDLKDKKILTLLDENARYSNSQMAKKVGLSKAAIEYRIQRLEKNKLIFSYYTVIDFTKLGYSQYKLYYKFQNTNPALEKEIQDYWKNVKNTGWIGQIRGRWDLAVSLLIKDAQELGIILNSFMKQYAQYILEKDVLLTEYSPIYGREYLTTSKPSKFVYGSKRESIAIDTTDVKILSYLANNARTQVLTMSQKIGLSRDIINYRIKKLLSEKVIVQYRCYPNLDNMGIYLYKFIFRVKNLEEPEEKRLMQYLTQHKKITQFLKLIGSWDMEIEVEAENEDEAYRILNELRNEFSPIIRDYDIIRITKTIKFTFFPF